MEYSFSSSKGGYLNIKGTMSAVDGGGIPGYYPNLSAETKTEHPFKPVQYIRKKFRSKTIINQSQVPFELLEVLIGILGFLMALFPR